MRLLNVNLSINPEQGGGTAERTYQMTHWLNGLGVDCRVLLLDLNFDNTFIYKQKIITLKCINKRFYIPEPSLLKIYNSVQDVDVVHLIGHWTLLNALVYLSARIHKKPYVFCPAGALVLYGRSIWLKKIYNLFVGNKIIKNSTRCVAITKNEVGELNKYGVNSSKITLIPNGINQDEFEIYKHIKIRDKFNLSNKKIILFVGRLNKIKGIDILVDAFIEIHSNYPNYQLVIAGPDEGMAAEIIKKIENSNIKENITLIGRLDRKLKSYVYHAAEFLVIPSRREAMSIVVLEAGICGKPVLITDQCGFEIVEYIDGGRVVNATTEGIKNGLIYFLDNNDCLEKMGKNLKNHVKKKYLWINIAKSYLDLFLEISGTNNK